ncbi:MAG: contractile injection system tape measure protein [Bacteroidota bacterium]
MKTDQHIIHRVNLEIEFNGPAETHELSSRIRDLLYRELLPKLENWLNGWLARHDLTQRTIRFDRLDLDLGRLDPKLSDRVLQQQIWEQIEPEIQQQIQLTTSEFPGPQSDLDLELNDKVLIPKNWTELEIFLFFLETGRLPWQAKRLTFETWEQAIITQLKAASKAQKQHLARTILDTPKALDRIQKQFDKPFIQDLLTGFFSQYIDSMVGLSNWVALFFKYFPAFRQMLDTTEEQSGLQEAQLIWALNQQLGAGFSARTSITHLVNYWARTVPGFRQMWEENFAIKKPTLPNIYFPELGTLVPPSDPKTKPRSPRKEEEKSLEPEGYIIENAGLVLLHPFLKPYFNDFDLLEGAAFTTIEAQKQTCVSII